MKRVLLIVLTASAVLISVGGTSPASQFHKHRFTADLQGGLNNAGLELNAFFKNGEPQYVTDLEWHNVSCGGPYAGVQHWSINVTGKGKFNKTHAIHGGYQGSTVTITGKFSHQNRRLAGTFSVSATPGCPTGTGSLPYRTHRG